jgi:hypothetical protein
MDVQAPKVPPPLRPLWCGVLYPRHHIRCCQPKRKASAAEATAGLHAGAQAALLTQTERPRGAAGGAAALRITTNNVSTIPGQPWCCWVTRPELAARLAAAVPPSTHPSPTGPRTAGHSRGCCFAACRSCRPDVRTLRRQTYQAAGRQPRGQALTQEEAWAGATHT